MYLLLSIDIFADSQDTLNIQEQCADRVPISADDEGKLVLLCGLLVPRACLVHFFYSLLNGSIFQRRTCPIKNTELPF